MAPVILVVDDDDDLRDTMCMVVECAGYSAVPMCRAADALDYVKQSPTPAAILLDLMMPGMSGGDLCDKLRALPAATRPPILVVTAFRDKRHMPADATAVLFKPFSAETLIAALERTLAH